MGEPLVINDFLVAVGNDMDEELGTHRFFTIVADPKVKNRRIIFQLQARDVPIRKRGGWYFFHHLFGRKPIIGKTDMSQVRELSVAEDMVLQIKTGKPSIYIVFAEKFENLPKSFKDDAEWKMAFQMRFLVRQNREALADLYTSANLQQNEIQDRLSQSQTMLNDFVLKQMQNFQQAIEQGERKKLVEGGQPQQKPPQQGFY